MSAAPAWPHFTYATYWDGMGLHAFGSVRGLLEFVTLSATMGVYLNTEGNQKEDPASGRLPDKNYPRELIQLFTVGLYELHPDGRQRLDGQGRLIETYNSSDVSQLARVFTGYEIDKYGPRVATLVGNRTVPTHPYSRRAMRHSAQRHSSLQARFLGTTVLAGVGHHATAAGRRLAGDARTRRRRVAQAVLMVMLCPGYLVKK